MFKSKNDVIGIIDCRGNGKTTKFAHVRSVLSWSGVEDNRGVRFSLHPETTKLKQNVEYESKRNIVLPLFWKQKAPPSFRHADIST